MADKKLTQAAAGGTFGNNAVIHVADPDNLSQGADGSSFKYPFMNLAKQADLNSLASIVNGLSNAQNNVGRWINYGFQLDNSDPEGAGITANMVASYINGFLVPIVVTSTQTPVVFEFQKGVSGGTERYIFFFMKGKGSWGATGGVGGNAVTAADFKMLPVVRLILEDIDDDPNTITFDLGEIDPVDFLTEANSEVRVLNDPDRVYYFIYTYEGVDYSMRFVGGPGIYGGGGTDLLEADFVTGPTSETPATPDWQMVLSAGSEAEVSTDVKLIKTGKGSFVIDDNGVKMYSGDLSKSVRVTDDSVIIDSGTASVVFQEDRAVYDTPVAGLPAVDDGDFVPKGQLRQLVATGSMDFQWPAAYTFRPFRILENSGKFIISITMESLFADKISKLRPYYVDFANGSNSNAGSIDAAFKTITYALTQGAKLIYLKSGIHQNSTFATFNNNSYGSDDKFIIAMDPENTFITQNTEGLTWGAASGIYSASVSGSTPGGLTMGIVDFKFRDAYNRPKRLEQKTNLTDVQATAGSYWLDSANSLLYVNTPDSRMPDSDVIALTRYLAKTFNLAASECLYVQGVRFMGGTSAAGVSTVSSAATLGNAFFNKCEYMYSYDNGFRVQNTGGLVWTNECISYDTGRDGFNYTQHATLTSQKVIETYNEAWMTGVHTASTTDSALNPSSAHNNVTILRVGCKYYGGVGPNVIDIGGAQSLNIGVECFDSLGFNDSTTGNGANWADWGDFAVGTYAGQNPTRMWLYGCKSRDSRMSFNTPEFLTDNVTPDLSEIFVDNCTWVAPYSGNVTFGQFITGDAPAYAFPSLGAVTVPYDPTGEYFPLTAYAQTLAYNGTAPSGTLTANWIAAHDRPRKMVTVTITAVHSVAGTGNSAVSIPLPTGLPLPKAMPGWTTNNDFMLPATGYFYTGTGAAPVISRAVLRKVASGYSLYITAAAAAYVGFNITLTYWVD